MSGYLGLPTITSGDDFLDTVQEMPEQTVVPAPPSAGNVTELYVRAGRVYWMDSAGVEHPADETAIANAAAANALAVTANAGVVSNDTEIAALQSDRVLRAGDTMTGSLTLSSTGGSFFDMQGTTSVVQRMMNPQGAAGAQNVRWYNRSSEFRLQTLDDAGAAVVRDALSVNIADGAINLDDAPGGYLGAGSLNVKKLGINGVEYLPPVYETTRSRLMLADHVGTTFTVRQIGRLRFENMDGRRQEASNLTLNATFDTSALADAGYEFFLGWDGAASYQIFTRILGGAFATPAGHDWYRYISAAVKSGGVMPDFIQNGNRLEFTSAPTILANGLAAAFTRIGLNTWVPSIQYVNQVRLSASVSSTATVTNDMRLFVRPATLTGLAVPAQTYRIPGDAFVAGDTFTAPLDVTLLDDNAVEYAVSGTNYPLDLFLTGWTFT